MNDIVFQGSEGQPLTNSVLVAEKFGKVHKNVIRTIQGLITTAQNCAVLIAENSAERCSLKQLISMSRIKNNLCT